MAIIKCTAIFAVTTFNGRAGGWSESWYTNQLGIQQAQNEFPRLMQGRMALCSRFVFLRFLRYTDIAVPGVTAVASLEGAAKLGGALDPDIPQMSLQIMCRTGFGLDRALLCRGVPDDIVEGGDYSPTPAYKRSVDRFCALIRNGSWLLRGIDHTVPLLKVITVSGEGVVTTSPVATWPLGSTIRFFRTYDTNGKPVLGDFNVSDDSVPATRTLAGWTPGREVLKGKARLISTISTAVTDAFAIGITTRKVGAPFFPFVGRASKRR